MYSFAHSTGLPFEIIVLIAEKDPITWAKISLADPDFCKWAATECNIVRFLKLFLKTIQATRGKDDWVHSIIEYRLFTDTPPRSWFDHVTRIDNIYKELEWHHHENQYRDNDRPTIISACGTRYWYRNNHRDGDSPSIICPDGNTIMATK
jgi:hypothetical protein